MSWHIADIHNTFEESFNIKGADMTASQGKDVEASENEKVSRVRRNARLHNAGRVRIASPQPHVYRTIFPM
jgi:hypothetical protein